MSSDPSTDEFTDIMRAAGFEVEDESSETTTEEYNYVGAVLTYETDNGLPVTVRVEYPEGFGMDAARAIVASASADAVKILLAYNLAEGDGSVHGYMDANGIDSAKYLEDASALDHPTLDDANAFFDLN